MQIRQEAAIRQIAGVLVLIVLLLGGCRTEASVITKATFEAPTLQETSSPSVELPTPETTSSLRRVLDRMPVSFKERGVWFSDIARTLELAGGPPFQSSDALLEVTEAERAAYLGAYIEALRGTALGSALMPRARETRWKEVFGFHWFDVKLAASSGAWSTEPTQVSYFEGDFDARVIRRKLQHLGYAEHKAAGQSYYAVRGDFGIDCQDEGSSLALNSMNRVFVNDGVLIAAPATEMLVPILEARAGIGNTLMDDRAFGHLAEMLGDPLSATLLTNLAIFRPEETEVSVDEGVQNLSALPTWEALGVGFYRSRDGDRWWCFALFYSDPYAAATNAPKLVKRMQNHTATPPPTLSEGQFQEEDREIHLFDQFCHPGIRQQMRRWSDGSALAIWCPLSEDAPPGLWHVLIDERRLDFLLP